jgi:signal peptidase II
MTATTDWPRARAVCATTATAFLILDHLSKYLVAHHSGWQRGLYPPADGSVVISGFFNLVYTVNYGAAWGILQGYGWILVTLACIILIGILLFLKPLLAEHRHNQFIFGLLIAGILGNTIDRVVRGHVVDFLDFILWGYRWPTFNVADSAIVVGTLWYLLLQLMPQKIQQPNRSNT